ncbi:hypothetical protein J7L70_06155 [Candidatus Bathyarchaeota archaeon]|nr:hypothetical protein [Candidatus Bathyarchaeota archaeon]
MAYPYYPYFGYGYPWMSFDPFTAFYYWIGMMYYLYMFRIWMDIWAKFVEMIPGMFPTAPTAKPAA